MKLQATALNKLRATLRATALTSLARALVLEFPRAEVYLVGGYLRDLILGRDSKDIDLVVRGVPARRLLEFLQRAGAVNLVGRRFGVFKFIPKHKTVPAIDIALPRKEHALGTGGYRDVRVHSDWKLSIEEDLGRRDFTVNALAWDITKHHLVDPHGGIGDLRLKSIRAVGVPAARFREDYSRLLRALRFASELNFTIETRTWNAIKKYITRLQATRRGWRVVPYEVIAKEFIKAFLAHAPRALELFDKAGALRVLIPELLAMKGCPQPPAYHREGNVWTHTMLALSVLASPKFRKEFGTLPTAEMIMAVLFHDIAKPKTITMPTRPGERIRFDGHDKAGALLTKKIALRLRLSSYKDEHIDVDPERLAWLVRHHLLLISGDPLAMRATTIERHYLRDERIGKELLALQFADGSATLDAHGRGALHEYRVMRRRIEEMLGRRKRALPPPLLNGNEIMKTLNLKPGPEVGKILSELREAQLSGKIKTKEQGLRFIKNL